MKTLQLKELFLKVNTPGGGVVESAEIYDAIRAIQEESRDTCLCINGWNGCFWRLLCSSACG